MNRLFFASIIICQLIALWSVNCSAVGPKNLPTKGEVWPSPQREKKNGIVYYVLRPSKLNVFVSNHTCELLTRALERYDLILRDLELIQSLNYFDNNLQRGKKDQNYNILKELKIDLSSKCEETPHYEMDEKYSLKIDKFSVLKSKSIWGILRGLETFAQLFYFPDDYSIWHYFENSFLVYFMYSNELSFRQNQRKTKRQVGSLNNREIRVNATMIYDYPQYKHRGLLIDTGRHYLSLSTIYKIIDALAMNKMNVLHWHITDDQSFPYQSERFPTLSKKGAFWPTMVYTRADIRSVVAFARDRGVRVIPEIDSPGHTRSWGEAFPQLLTKCYESNKVVSLGPLDPTRTDTYEFLKQLFHEVHHWFPDEFFHMGGDEVQVQCWNSNPHIRAYLKKHNITVNNLQSHYMNRTVLVMPKQTKLILWQEAFDMKAIHKQKAHVQVWNFNWIEEMDKILKAGHYVIFSSSWYLDYKNPSWQDFYRADPRQMVYSLWKNSTGLENIVGGEACMWGEMTDDTNILSKTWPRTSAVAERLWTGLDYDNLNPVTNTATRRIEEHTCRMNRRGIPAQPPNGPSFCVGAPPPPLQTTYYQVHNV